MRLSSKLQDPPSLTCRTEHLFADDVSLSYAPLIKPNFPVFPAACCHDNCYDNVSSSAAWGDGRALTRAGAATYKNTAINNLILVPCRVSSPVLSPSLSLSLSVHHSQPPSPYPTHITVRPDKPLYVCL